jgi:hypothetical protein
VKKLAFQLPRGAWRTLTWRQGSNAPLRSRFAALRVRAADQDWLRSELREEEWLLIDWPESEAEPVHYWLCTLPASAKLRVLARTAMTRGRIERDYQELKQEFGLSHYEGRGWRGFAAYGFLLGQQLKSGSAKKNSARSQAFLLPKGYTPRGSRKNATPRSGFHRYPSLPARSRHPLASTSANCMRLSRNSCG